MEEALLDLEQLVTPKTGAAIDARIIVAREEASRLLAETANRGEANIQLPMPTFRRLLEMLLDVAQLAEAATPSGCSKELSYLKRIANLEVRGARELIELKAWKRIAAELQAIAQEALGQAKVPLKDSVAAAMLSGSEPPGDALPYRSASRPI